MWWVLIFAAAEPVEADSITSGYVVPCTMKSTSPRRAASSSKTWMKVSPIWRRFRSGSVMPPSSLMKRSWASRWMRLIAMCSRNVETTRSASSARSRPLSTKMHVSWSPTARWTSVAATAESTPPESAQMTRPVPTWSAIVAMDSSTKEAGVQSPAQPAMLVRKLSSS